eukprot:c47347_g1_i1 orf=183-1196(+)
MSVQGQSLEINVIGCKNLKDTEWLSKQDPYVVLEYANARFRTKTDTDGGRNPSFNEKFSLSLIEGLREVNIQVWNSNSVTYDDFIGSGKILLSKVLSSGYDDSSWPLATKSGKHAGEARVIMHFANAKNQHAPSSQHMPPVDKMHTSPSPTAPPYQSPMTDVPYPASAGYPPPTGYPPVGYPSSSEPSAKGSFPSGYYPVQTPLTAHSPPPSGYPPAGYPSVPGPGTHGPSSSGYFPQQSSPYVSPPQAPYGAYPPPAYPPQVGHGMPHPGAYPAYPGSLGMAHSGHHGGYMHGKHKGKHKHKPKYGKFGKFAKFGKFGKFGKSGGWKGKGWHKYKK